jgi:hypothetical protein
VARGQLVAGVARGQLVAGVARGQLVAEVARGQQAVELRSSWLVAELVHRDLSLTKGVGPVQCRLVCVHEEAELGRMCCGGV